MCFLMYSAVSFEHEWSFYLHVQFFMVFFYWQIKGSLGFVWVSKYIDAMALIKGNRVDGILFLKSDYFAPQKLEFCIWNYEAC